MKILNFKIQSVKSVAAILAIVMLFSLLPPLPVFAASSSFNKQINSLNIIVLRGSFINISMICLSLEPLEYRKVFKGICC